MYSQGTVGGLVAAGQRRPLLSTALATPKDKRTAAVIAVVALLAFVAIVPFVRIPLAAMPAFIPSYEAALFFIDLITAILLYDQFIRVRSSGILFLASGYLFDALIIVAHALSFPGAFSPSGLLGAKEQTTAWLYVFWHGGFSLLVLGYALWERWANSARTGWAPEQVKGAIVASIAGVAALTVVLVLISTWGHDRLPVVMQGSDYSLLVTNGISPAVWVLTLIAMVMLYRREQRVMDLWLMLVMWIWLFDIALAAVIGSTRFDLGFYAGRIFGLIASGFLLAMLLIETIKLYSSALGAADSAEQKLAQLARAQPRGSETQARSSEAKARDGEAQNGKKARGESVELFVQRQNIEHYRSLLKSQPLNEAQRHTIEKLLSEEEAKYRES